jgi:DNA-binding NtrC family response regulator
VSQRSAARGNGDHAEEFTVAGASLSKIEAVTEEDLSDLLKIKERIDPNGSYIGQSAAILRIFKKIEIFNRTPTKPVLILGPTGAGKTEIVRLIHTSSSRRAKGFHREQGADIQASDFSLLVGNNRRQPTTAGRQQLLLASNTGTTTRS